MLRINHLGGAVLVCLTIFCSACLMCEDQGCEGGFILSAAPLNGEALPVGAYRLMVSVESQEFEVQCTVNEDADTSFCEHNPDLPKEWNYVFSVHSTNILPEDNSSASIATQFHVSIYHIEESKIKNNIYETSYTGPSHVTLRIEFNGTTIGNSDFSPSYTRDNDYRGDDRCGYCDTSNAETMGLIFP